MRKWERWYRWHTSPDDWALVPYACFLRHQYAGPDGWDYWLVMLQLTSQEETRCGVMGDRRRAKWHAQAIVFDAEHQGDA